MSSPTLADLMTRDIVRVALDASISDATAVMAERRISCVLVADDTGMRGIVTERDILRAMRAHLPGDTPVSSIMSGPVITAPGHLDLRSGYREAAAQGVRHLVITDKDQRPAGIVTETDFRHHIGFGFLRQLRQVSALMSKAAAQVPPEATLADALLQMELHRTSYSLVVENQRAIGILTERDVVRFCAKGIEDSSRIARIMMQPVMSVHLGTSVADAAHKMQDAKFRHLVVVDDDGNLVGVLGEHDLMRPLELELADSAVFAQHRIDSDDDNTREQLAEAMEAINDGIWDNDFVSNRLTLNTRCWEIIGWPVGSLPGTLNDWVALIHPDDMPTAVAHYKQSLKNGAAPYRGEYRLRRKDGQYRWVMVRGAVIEREPTGRARRSIGSVIDINERKAVEQELAASEERLRMALNVGQTGMWDIDFDTAHVSYSEAGLATFGYSVDDVPDNPEGWLAMIHPDDVDEVRAVFDAHIAGDRDEYLAEYRLRDAANQWRWVLDRGQVVTRYGDGSPRRALGCFIDITERKQIEEGLHVSRNALAEAQTVGRIGSWSRDATTGDIECSDETCHLFGLPDGAMKGTTDLLARIHEDDHGLLRTLWNDAVHGRPATQITRLRVGNRLRWVELRARANFDWSGRATHVVGTAQDITDLHTTQLMLEVQTSLARLLAAGHTREEVLQVILDSALRIEPFDCGGLYQRTAEGHYELALQRNLSESFAKSVNHVARDTPRARLIDAGHLVCSCIAGGSNCTDADLIGSPHLRNEGLQSLIVLPIIADGKSIASLNLASRRSAVITNDTVRQLEVMALQFGETLERLTAQETVRHQTDNLQHLFETLVDFLFILDSQGVILHANHVVFDRLGYAPDELIGQPVLAVHPPELHADATRVMSDMLAGHGTVCNVPLQCADGQRIAVETRVVHGMWNGAPALFGISQDISERVAAEAHQRLAASVFNSADEGIMITDTHGNIIDVNDAFTAITGYERADVLGKSPSLLKSGSQSSEYYAEMWRALKAEGYWRGEIQNRTKAGNFYAEQLTITAVRDEAGRTTHFVGMFSDITVAKEQQHRLRRMAHYDSLTQLPNRVLLADRLSQAMAQAQRDNRLLAICYLDLDGFKPVNDKFGHDVGDQLLREVALRLRDCVRGTDTVARLGGDEFSLLLGNLESVVEVEHGLERTLMALSRPFTISGHSISVSGSIGVTLYPTDDADGETLLRHADQAMYEAKQSGRNGYALFDAEQDKHVRSRRGVLTHLRKALDNNEFELFFQPKVDMRHGTVIGAEALVRWNHPERGRLAPAEFLPHIEDSELEIPFGHWVLTHGIEQAARWHANGLSLCVSINIAGAHLMAPSFAKDLAVTLASHPELPPALIELEVLETAALDDMNQVTDIIAGCQRLGVGFALDDFGTGYSSLTYFRHLPVDTLKIDQSFVRDMLENGDDMAIVEGVIGISQAFRRKVVAEGVESVEHGLILLQLGCELAQGYGIARPMPASAIPDWVAAYRPDAMWQTSSAFKWRREDLNLLAIELAVKRWCADVLGDAATRQTAAAIKADRCVFDHWLKSPHTQRYAAMESFAQITTLHNKLHECAHAMLDDTDGGTAANGAHDAARTRFIEQRDEFFEQFHQLQAEWLITGSGKAPGAEPTTVRPDTAVPPAPTLTSR